MQNFYLWNAYAVCRQRILAKNGPADLGEKFLYHGTSAESCDCIEKDRFDRNFSGTHGKESCHMLLIFNSLKILYFSKTINNEYIPKIESQEQNILRYYLFKMYQSKTQLISFIRTVRGWLDQI